MAVTPQELVTGFFHLTSLPEVFIRLNKAMAEPGYTAVDIGNIITHDPALSVRLLKIVNSPFYGFHTRIDTISRAVAVIGSSDLQDIILATYVTRLFDGISSDLVDMETFWRHSIYCGVIARLLAQQQRLANKERYFLCGLLHEVGSLLIYQKLPELAREALLRASSHGANLSQSEYEVLGFSHAEVGATLLRAWQLPASLISAVEHHHAPENADEFMEAAMITYLANAIANNNEQGKHAGGQNPTLDSLVNRLSGLSMEVIEGIIQTATVQFDEARRFVMPEPPGQHQAADTHTP